MQGMKCFILLLFGAATMSHAVPSKFSLPRNAEIKILKSGRDDSTETWAVCERDFKLSNKKIRGIFKTYSELTDRELHDDYIWAPCYIEGIISIAQKSFTWRARPGNLLETDYPDGKKRILGGQLSDKPGP